ncbi:MAG TPA: DUF4236 domain-containing protein [Longimicrobium sp.]|nr:DUF4236 domain-containing protein [Longimicrobium sp.]
MAFRFRRSFKIAPGVRLNLSRSGVSTTLGVRGLSVNTGRRGTFVNTGIPGSGISARTRLGGRGGGHVRAAAGGGTASTGCGCCGGLGVLFMVFVGFCGAIAGNPGGGPGHPPLLTRDTGYSATHEARETFYIHGTMNIRSAAGTAFPVVRTLKRGDRVDVGAKDSQGWARVYASYGEPGGYIYRASHNLRTYAPPARSSSRTHRQRRTRAHPAGASAICRDGTYSYSANRRGTCSWHGGVGQWL